MGRLPFAYALFLALVAVQRLAELSWSRRNLQRMRAREPASTSPRAESAPGFAAMVAVHVASILLPAVEVAWRGTRAPLAVWLPGLGFFALAQVLRYWTIRTLGEAWNVRAEVSPVTRVVTTGPYRWIRHPNYLAVCAEMIAIPAIGGAWISLVALQALHIPVLLRRIRSEERLLFALPGYECAMSSRGRLLPRVGPVHLRRPVAP